MSCGDEIDSVYEWEENYYQLHYKLNENGKIIGMSVGFVGTGGGTGFCIPAEVCKQAIERQRVVQEFK